MSVPRSSSSSDSSPHPHPPSFTGESTVNHPSRSAPRSINDDRTSSHNLNTTNLPTHPPTTTSPSLLKLNISNSNATVHIHKDLLMRLHNFFINQNQQVEYQQQQVYVLLFGYRTHTYQNKNIHIESFKIIYNIDIFNEYIKTHHDENNLELLGFSSHSCDEYINIAKLKGLFQFFHQSVLKHYWLIYQQVYLNNNNNNNNSTSTHSNQLHQLNFKSILERYIGLNIKYCIQDQIYGGEDEVFVQLLSYNTKVYSPYIQNSYTQTLYGNILCSINDPIDFQFSCRQDINLVVNTGQLSQFSNDVLSMYRMPANISSHSIRSWHDPSTMHLQCVSDEQHSLEVFDPSSSSSSTTTTTTTSTVHHHHSMRNVPHSSGTTATSSTTFSDLMASSSSSQNPIAECMNQVFLSNNSIPYLEKWISDQLDDHHGSEIMKLLREYELLEKENALLREELDLINSED
ncbi:hypothetical protein FDP41_011822 [Naegleria fowleri]|uniref:Uncharacterized protein n=1 Tax=Naegleria fowleri TaxID=5763 RepID=A0A6A5C4E2_NAEFO|nr:uncharacterized protein FDP41_011822 [Naegleria fowleri]KAF0981961.1 hypothetical protein FDP41_011822 [Naegleria fowleri]